MRAPLYQRLLGSFVVAVAAFLVLSVYGNENDAKRPPADNRRRDITFDDLKFPIEKDAEFKDELLTDRVRALAGKPVKLRGFMFPCFSQTGITEFILVRDNLECCFGPGAALYDCVVVKMKPGTSTNYSIKPIAVEGVFTLNKLEVEGVTRAVFQIDATKAQ